VPSLLEDLERDALDSGGSLADALRKCISLGGRAGSAELRDWASRELQGYEDGTEPPAYREIVAPIVVDGFAGSMYMERHMISASDLPDVAQDAGIDENVTLRFGVGQLEELVRDARAKDRAIQLGLPGSGQLAALMTYEQAGGLSRVERVYWNVSPSAVAGVLDQIRTRLVSLVAEIRAAAADPDAPSEEEATNAFNVVFHGKARNVRITSAQAAAGNAFVTPEAEEKERPWWRRTKVIWGFVIGVATIAGTIAAWLLR
jgi:AbiTii-like protein